MSVVVNARFLTQRITGVQRFAIEICKQLKKIDPSISFVAPNNVVNIDIADLLEVKMIGNKSGHLWEQYDLPRYLKSNGSPLLINLGNTAPLLYRNSIVTIYDLAFFHHKNWFSWWFSAFYNYLIPRVLRKSRHVFTDSNYVKNDISSTYSIKAEKITTLYGDCSNIFKSNDEVIPLKENIILAIGSLDPRKNLVGLVKAFLRNNLDCKLVIVGSKNKVFADHQLDELVRNENNIEITGYLNDAELVELYKKAKLFVYPSFFEGFGIPPLEAQACGCPALVADTTSLPEVCDDSVIYCNPDDINDIADKMSLIITNKELQAELIMKGFENIKRFSWSDSAKIVYGKIKEIQ